MNNNSFQQIQILINQVSNYVSKINGIIFQINNIINYQNQMNQMNQMMQMDQMNEMKSNNMMNFQDNINNNLHPKLNNQVIPPLNCKIMNITFEYKNDPKIVITQKNLPLNDAINNFLKKINKPELINNYKNKMIFLFNAKKLDSSKTVEEISDMDFKIRVIEL